MIDVDKLFEDYLRGFLAKNAGKFTEDELEDKVPEIYEKFGNTPIEALGGKTPSEYFSSFTGKELVDMLKDCVKDRFRVSDFLCEAIENADGVDDLLLSLVDEKVDEELAMYAVNLLNSRSKTDNFDKYVYLILSENISENLKEAMTETLVGCADKVKGIIIENYNKKDFAKQYFIEVLSSCLPDDRVFDILIDEFKNHQTDMSLYVQYLTKYGDDRALPYFLEAIRKDISFVDYKELKIGIEALGGECDVEKDFSSDAVYKKYKN